MGPWGFTNEGFFTNEDLALTIVPLPPGPCVDDRPQASQGRTLLGRTLHRVFTNERGRPKADQASQSYAWPPLEPGDIIRARIGLGRALPSREPGEIVRTRLGLGRTLLDLLKLPYRPTDRPLGTDRPTVRARLGLG